MGISIHALLAESDENNMDGYKIIYISIHALLAESDEAVSKYMMKYINISIHALLAESDSFLPRSLTSIIIFLSTLSLRRAT